MIPEVPFYVRSDGSFQAFMGDVVIKAVGEEDLGGYHFEAIASTPDKDRDKETMIQEGLNFEPFMEHGEFNWNHIPYALVGFPVGKKAWLEKGLWRTEGQIIKGLPIFEGYDTDHVIKQHTALKKSGFPRGLCCSIEGKVTKRSKCGKYVHKASIYNIALTFRPVNPNCTVDVLAKSIAHQAVMTSNDAYYKALSVAQSAPFAREDLEGGASRDETIESKLIKHLCAKGYKHSEAKVHVKKWLMKKISKKG